MVWNPGTNQFDVNIRPAFITAGRLHMAHHTWANHHRVPWPLLCRALNETVSRRRDLRTLNALLSLGPTAPEPLITSFDAAARVWRPDYEFDPNDIAALNLVELEVFSLPCNLFQGPKHRADKAGGEQMDFTADGIDGQGSIVSNSVQGDLQRLRERAMSALIHNDVDKLTETTRTWIDTWTAPVADGGLALARATADAYNASFWIPAAGAGASAAHRAMFGINGAKLTAEESGALNAVVEDRVQTKYAAVFQIVEFDDPLAPTPPPPAPTPIKPDPIVRRIERYGWHPDLPDHRDRVLRLGAEQTTALPRSVDLRPGCPPVYDQGAVGSCTGNAIAAAIQYDRLRQSLAPDFTPSRLFIYYNERHMEGTIDSDSGAQIRDGIKCVADSGVCTEDDWPYDTTKVFVRPPDAAFTDALGTRAVEYLRLDPTLTQLKGCLAAGFPFVFGFTVYESFEGPAVAASGIVPMPSQEDRMIGGHAVLAVGYDDADEMMLVRNSWGPNWALGGYFKLPYAYVTNDNLAADFWTIRIVSAPPTKVSPKPAGEEETATPHHRHHHGHRHQESGGAR